MKKIVFCLVATAYAGIMNAQLKIDNAVFFISAGATVTVQGDVTSNVDIQGTGLLQLKGSTLQNVDMGGFTIPNLEIDNTSNVNLTTNAMIGTSMAFTNGKLLLNSSDLRLDAGVTAVTGGSSSRFIVTNGTGRVMKRSLGASSFSFPVGFSVTEFNPLTIANSGTVDTIGVRCLQNVLNQGLTGSPVTADFANNSWVLTEATAGGSNLSLTGEWVAGDELSNFNRVKSGIARYTSGTDWDLPASSALAASGSGPYNRSRTNVTSTGVFAIADLDKVNTAKLSLKVFLQGPYNTTTGSIMNDNLRANNLIPTTQPYSATLNDKFTRVGVYDGTTSVNETVNPSVFTVTGNNAIVDWVYVSTLDPLTPSTKLQTRAALLQRDGDIVDVDGVSPLSVPIDADGNYNVLIGHRNHLSIRTGAPLSLVKNATLPYSFTTGQSQAFQNPAYTSSNNAMAQDGSVFLMWGGNANMDSTVRVTTLLLTTGDPVYILGTVLSGNPNTVLSSVYSPADVNMDGTVRINTLLLTQGERPFILGTAVGGNPGGLRKEHK